MPNSYRYRKPQPTALPPVPPHVAEQWREDFIVSGSIDPGPARDQLIAMGIPTGVASDIYYANWYHPDVDDTRLMVQKDTACSPFAVTDPRKNFGYPVSFVTDPQTRVCVDPATTHPDLFLAVRRTIASHEKGHHIAVHLRAHLMDIGGLNREAAAFMLDENANVDAVTVAAMRVTEAFCDGFSSLRIMRDEPHHARQAINWVRKSRLLSLWEDIETAAEGNDDAPVNLTQYAIHQVSTVNLDFCDDTLPRVRGATDIDLAEMAVNGTQALVPVIMQEAEFLERAVRRQLQTPRRRHLLARAIAHARHNQSYELLSEQLSPAQMLRRTMRLQRQMEEGHGPNPKPAG